MDRNGPGAYFDEIPICLYAIDPDGRPIVIDLADFSMIGADCEARIDRLPHLKLLPLRDSHKLAEAFSGQPPPKPARVT
ncbi:hypothetical protein [Thiocystis violascens]|uniref:Uncharacterized protein n=1 Tax=Thiocystis violascens (strain ATCC 17096 / DSM 198 / 6111) TaxID=765911 RepID=I3YF00_THIV6|nr:hypothetical protein [Thiocystis violascens]AFL75568.1 hypothetical protein Thivi_3720 [Thiocystis violascens DSM 198]